MTTFANAVVSTNLNKKTTTTNGMKARVSSGTRLVDFFFKSGAMRGQDIIPIFTKAFEEDNEIALRIAQWLRDARGGAGERQHFRNILLHLEIKNSPYLDKLLPKISELGRWDDLLIFQTKKYKEKAFALLKAGLENPSTEALVKKWIPREKSAKKAIAYEFRKFLGLSPKEYRKMLSTVTTTETLMCAKKWTEINFSHVPSLASSRYRKAFLKNAKDSYEAYVQKLVDGDASVKVNATGLYPYQITQNINLSVDAVTTQFLNAQWNALPNYVGDAKILPMIDVSGSMSCSVGVAPELARYQKQNLTCMDISKSLGMYLAMKNTGPFKNVFLTFSSEPTLGVLSDDIVQNWNYDLDNGAGYSTNIEAAFREVLRVAVEQKIDQKDMPEYLVILSDMQFNEAWIGGKDVTSLKLAKKLYKDAGYEMPAIIYWNINAYDNVPVKFDTEGTALISGFSPSIVEAVLSANLENTENITPYDVMLEAVMKDKYAI